MQLIDLTGQKIGHLIVLERAENKNGRAQWKCECECGNVVTISSGDLRHKGRPRLYCSNQCIIKNKPIDLKGQRFGRLTALQLYMPDNKHLSSRGVYWICQCDCGNITCVDSYDLRTGKTKSCGCLRKESVSEMRTKIIDVGERFGKLTVLKYLYNKNGNAWWECKCDCGNIIQTTGSKLRFNEKLSCGCLNSHGEGIIIGFLTLLNIPYKTQYFFPDLLSENKSVLKFDFALFNKNNELKCLIEYDGIQHFEEVAYFNLSLETVQKRDQLKNDYCNEKCIPLIRFNYQELDNKILTKDYFYSKIEPFIKE